MRIAKCAAKRDHRRVTATEVELGFSELPPLWSLTKLRMYCVGHFMEVPRRSGVGVLGVSASDSVLHSLSISANSVGSGVA